jgi:zinc and cadmium transporter
VPQEFGDFGVLIHEGWPKRRALVLNVLSALTLLVGSLVAYVASFAVDVAWLVPFAAGNFLYIGASDLVPEIKEHPTVKANMVHLTAFLAGLGILYVAQLFYVH